ncbi:anti-sigma factor domain-containing protein [Auraticoccus monumenti]|uniref:Anti-sigma-K factor rskA n=1 Tax=Auraticoccus monumenti TaxID=675864 RepID=A0A1G6WC06_9ACTN|nr:anti-sigma factor [Auraticoccus monumenti]SDD62757.1 Anti-sigma-K factor rskA [Auraticoccus monumenti]
MHLPADLLALLALGEDAGSSDDLRHLSECPECRSELSELRRVVAVGRSLDPDGELVPPAPEVWDRVLAVTVGGASGAGTTAESAAGEEGEPAEPPADETPRRYADYLRPAPEQQGPGSTRPGTPGGATPLRPDRAPVRRRPVLALLAAAVALVVGIGLGLGWDRITAPAVREVARTELSPVGPLPAQGVARLVEGEDGQRELRVDLDEPADVDGELQVWLIAPDLSEMTKLGTLVGAEGRWLVPPDVDVTRWPLVDVSIEPRSDGDAAHSGNSLVRGELPA